MTELPKITVIIPTRERAITLKSALSTVTNQSYPNLEIIVSDNYSQDDTAYVVKNNSDHRIRYINTGKRLSMSHNWEFALNHVEDGWVTFLGDDDGLVPDAIEKIVNIINTTKALAIRTEYCVFDWPGVAADNPEGQLVVPLTFGYEVRNSKHWLERVLLGKSDYNQLPMVYTGGFIHISLFNKIKNSIGSFFNSINPDVFSAIALARITENYLYIKEPLAIVGTSKFSNGYSAFSTNKNRNTEYYAEFLSEKNIPLHMDIPSLQGGGVPLSLQVCVYEAYLQSKKLEGEISYITHHQQLPILLASGGKHRIVIDQWAKDFALLHSLNYEKIYRKIVYLRFFYSLNVFTRKFIRVKNSVVTNKLDIKNIYEASIAAHIILKKPSRLDSVRFLLKSFFSHINEKYTAN